MASETSTAIILASLLTGAASYAAYQVIQINQGNVKTIEATHVNNRMETVRIIVVRDIRDVEDQLSAHRVVWDPTLPSIRVLVNQKTCVSYILLSELSNSLTETELKQCQQLIDRNGDV